MIELELLGVGGDGQSLVLTDAEGERYSVPVTDELRAAVRRDRPRLESVASPDRALRPREIQSLLRGGLTAEEISSEYGLDVEHVRRFEAPVVAEKDWALSRALEVRVGDPGGPALGDLVVDRLAARGVDPESLGWSARRDPEGPWEICLTFVQGAAEHAAHWTMPNQSSVDAVDQEARWLTETASPAPVSAVFTPLPRPSAEAVPSEDVLAREALLDQLNAARGHRQEVDEDEDGAEVGSHGVDDSGRDSISARIYSLAHARTRTVAEPAAGASSAPAGGAQVGAGSQGSGPEGSGPEGSSPVGGAPEGSSPSPEGAEPSPPAAGDAGRGSTGRGNADGESTGAPGTGHAGTPAGGPAGTPSGQGRAGTAGSPTPAGIDEGGADTDGGVLPGLEEVRTPRISTERRKSRRRSVPSWDEIVFGQRH